MTSMSHDCESGTSLHRVTRVAWVYSQIKAAVWCSAGLLCIGIPASSSELWQALGFPGSAIQWKGGACSHTQAHCPPTRTAGRTFPATVCHCPAITLGVIGCSNVFLLLFKWAELSEHSVEDRGSQGRSREELLWEQQRERKRRRRTATIRTTIW